MNEFTISVAGIPRSKGRPRLGRRGRVFTPVATHEAEQNIASIWREANGPHLTGAIALEVDFHPKETVITVRETSEYPESRLRGDIDNYLKLVMDGLNGVAWDDDKQVVWLYAVKHNE
jgi:crossover junction endodeoxyribonuclease RusA